MTGEIGSELDGWPNALDLYARRAASVAIARRGAAATRATRVEAGSAVRERQPDGSLRLSAWTGAAAFPDPVQWPEEPHLPETSAAGADLRIQRSRVETSLDRRDCPRQEWVLAVTIATLSLPGPCGLLSRTRIGEDLEPAQVAADLTALAAARDLATRARAISPPPRIELAAAVAARMLALLWVRGRHPASPLPSPRAADLIDTATPGGGPLGAPFDDEGRATRHIVLAGDGAEPFTALGSIRPSFADLPLAAPRNLRLVPRAVAAAAAFVAIEMEDADPAAGSGLRFVLLGHDASGSAARIALDLDLATFLAAVTGSAPGSAGETWWTPAVGAVGSPAVGLDLGPESSGTMRYSAP